jgi:glyoxylase-like metal-dependent hydrolase (beta-lactamase superfamily II)
MQLAPGLHAIGGGVVNCYLVEEGGRITLIDAGLPGLWTELRSELGAMGRSLSDVAGLLLTHSDSDHVGFAERFRAKTGAPVFVHELEAAHARGQAKGKNPGTGRVRPVPLIRFLVWGMRHGGLRVTPIREVRPLHGGETLDLPGSPRIIHMPGHSVGSIAVHVPSIDAVFVGDALTTLAVTTGERGPRPAPFSEDPATAFESLSRIESLGARWVLPGHGEPWADGAAEAVAAVRRAAGSKPGSTAA